MSISCNQSTAIVDAASTVATDAIEVPASTIAVRAASTVPGPLAFVSEQPVAKEVVTSFVAAIAARVLAPARVEDVESRTKMRNLNFE